MTTMTTVIARTAISFVLAITSFIASAFWEAIDNLNEFCNCYSGNILTNSQLESKL